MPKKPNHDPTPKSSAEIADAAIAAARKNIAEGKALVDRAKLEHRLTDAEGDGPLMQAWKRGEPPAPAEGPIENDPTMLEKVAHVLAAARQGRTASAALGLARLREHFEAFGPTAATEWETFARRYFEPALGLDTVETLIGRMVHRNAALHCTKCGKLAKSACECGANYAPENQWAMPIAKPEPETMSALARATAAIAANPGKSDRAIAAEIGCNDKTIAKARRLAGESAPDSAPRVGRDGKRYRQRPLPPSDPDRDLIQGTHPDATSPAARWEWSAANAAGDAIAMRAYWKREFGAWEEFTPPAQLLALARQAAEEWQALAKQLEGRRKRHGKKSKA